MATIESERDYFYFVEFLTGGVGFGHASRCSGSRGAADGVGTAPESLTVGGDVGVEPLGRSVALLRAGRLLKEN